MAYGIKLVHLEGVVAELVSRYRTGRSILKPKRLQSQSLG